jgi:hypothetical protein
MATLIDWTGKETEVRPAIPERGFSRDELAKLLEGPVEISSLADGRLMVVANAELRRPRGPVNVRATKIFQEGRATGWAIFGNVLVGCPGEIL